MCVNIPRITYLRSRGNKVFRRGASARCNARLPAFLELLVLFLGDTDDAFPEIGRSSPQYLLPPERRLVNAPEIPQQVPVGRVRRQLYQGAC